MFQDGEFDDACLELFTPEVDDWEFFTEAHGVKIYRQYNAKSGLYSYKIYGTIDVDVDICKEVYLDTEYRPKWDTYVKDLSMVSEGDKKGLYWQVKYPFPLSNRDYCYIRELRQVEKNNKKIWVVLSRSETFETVPERSGVVRVTDFVQSLAIVKTDDGKTQAFMRYYDNPGGMIPSWLINWAAKTGVPTFLDGMEKACKGYTDYQHKHTT